MRTRGFYREPEHSLNTLRIRRVSLERSDIVTAVALTMHNLHHDSQQSHQNVVRRERLLKVLSAATFLIFFQAYMVAPLIPRFSAVFGISAQQIGLIVPAYLIPYGVSTLVYGVLSHRCVKVFAGYRSAALAAVVLIGNIPVGSGSSVAT